MLRGAVPGRHVKDAFAGAEGDLVRAACNGDRGAFVSLVKHYQNAVASVACALTGRFGASEDVTQETFLIAWQRLKEIRQPMQFGSFILGVARNKSLGALRNQRVASRNVELSSIEASLPPPDPSPLDRLISREEEEVALLALARAPETYRVVLTLFYLNGLSARQVARIVGLGEKNVRMRLLRGRRFVAQRTSRALSTVLDRAAGTDGLAGAGPGGASCLFTFCPADADGSCNEGPPCTWGPVAAGTGGSLRL